MIPVLGLPYISRSDLFVKTVTSINHPVDKMVVVDNSRDGSCPQVDGAEYIKMHRNMGVSWAWNTIIMQSREAPWWAISNSDLKYGKHDLSNLDTAMGEGRDLVFIESMALFGISAKCVQTVGWFDEMFVPAYCEDNDYTYRARLLGIEPHFIRPAFEHFGSATIKSDKGMREANARSYPQNVKYYQEKWGGLMHHEVYETPFNKGGSPKDCPTLDFDRLRALSWD